MRNRLRRKFDYAARDEANRKLGRAGEQWVIEFEQQRLTDLGRAVVQGVPVELGKDPSIGVGTQASVALKFAPFPRRYVGQIRP